MGDVKVFGRLRSIRSQPPVLDENAILVAALTRSANGDQVAFGELYDATVGLIYSITLEVLRDPSEAAAVTQEVFVEFWRLAPLYVGGRRE